MAGIMQICLFIMYIKKTFNLLSSYSENEAAYGYMGLHYTVP